LTNDKEAQSASIFKRKAFVLYLPPLKSGYLPLFSFIFASKRSLRNFSK
jgi:hypothetical protein